MITPNFGFTRLNTQSEITPEMAAQLSAAGMSPNNAGVNYSRQPAVQGPDWYQSLLANPAPQYQPGAGPRSGSLTVVPDQIPALKSAGLDPTQMEFFRQAAQDGLPWDGPNGDSNDNVQTRIGVNEWYSRMLDTPMSEGGFKRPSEGLLGAILGPALGFALGGIGGPILGGIAGGLFSPGPKGLPLIGAGLGALGAGAASAVNSGVSQLRGGFVNPSAIGGELSLPGLANAPVSGANGLGLSGANLGLSGLANAGALGLSGLPSFGGTPGGGFFNPSALGLPGSSLPLPGLTNAPAVSNPLWNGTTSTGLPIPQGVTGQNVVGALSTAAQIAGGGGATTPSSGAAGASVPGFTGGTYRGQVPQLPNIRREYFNSATNPFLARR